MERGAVPCGNGAGSAPNLDRTVPQIRAPSWTRFAGATESRPGGGDQTPVILIRNRIRWMDRADPPGQARVLHATNPSRKFNH